jgi:hypothetical protein
MILENSATTIRGSKCGLYALVFQIINGQVFQSKTNGSFSLTEDYVATRTLAVRWDN